MHKYRRLLLVALFLGLLLAAFQLSGLREHLSLEYLRDTLLAHKGWGLALFALLFALGNLIQIPGWIFLAAAVLALGRVWGGLATYLAATFSCCCTFLLIRLLGGSALRELDSKLARRILAHLDERPVLVIAALRVLFQTVPALNYALSLSGVRFRHYLIGTLLGLPLPIALYCVLFDYLGRALHIS
ncbi:VTT domain-containing protein [Pseudomonas sp. BN102]|uniref:TVP38/TMEM64 family protein n=1 Tax=Pseudomonas sp. BN102 TaxID=2567886 RepID=UPI002453B1BC|nr:VTT domain-containing protein [Pseudomonas sp. BN102]MDH4611302.1 VTT domain-containing protein [Pseudomonas sp. BN102]